MQGPEDFNTFNHHDCGGAMLMLSIPPAVISFVLLDNQTLAIILGAAAVFVSAIVYLLAYLTHWKIIPRIVDLLGMILTPLYAIAAVWLFIYYP